jgi:ribosomal protein S6
MPLYQQYVLCVPRRTPEKLAQTFKIYADAILKLGGVVRSVENEGIRSLPRKTQRYPSNSLLCMLM